MERYYSAIVFITLLTLGVIIIHLRDNETLSRKVKKKIGIIAILITIGSICEFLELYLNETNSKFIIIHGIIKAIELTIAPIIPILFTKIVERRNTNRKVQITILSILIINGICEFISIFTPFIFYIDKNNIYKHAFFYYSYTAMYLAGIIFFIVRLLIYTKKFQSRNLITLISILVFLVAGFLIRIFNENIHTDWLLVTIALLQFIIYYSDLVLKVDPLTNLLNRKSYQNRLRKIDYMTAIIILDANHFKEINDKYGHQFGDEILKIISKNILKAYGKYAHCYRIGGDEFCVILKRGKLEEITKRSKKRYDRYKAIECLNESFKKLLTQECDEYPMLRYGVSIGYGICYENNDEFKHSYYSSDAINEVIKIADKRMYKEKENTKLNKI